MLIWKDNLREMLDQIRSLDPKPISIERFLLHYLKTKNILGPLQPRLIHELDLLIQNENSAVGNLYAGFLFTHEMVLLLEAITEKSSIVDTDLLLAQIFVTDCTARALLLRNGVTPHRLRAQRTNHLGNYLSNESTQQPSFYYDLVKQASDGQLDEIFSRENEIEKCITILNRKTKNNPLLIGKSGVGKTAIVEGLALRIAKGNVPSRLKHKRIQVLNLGDLVAGTKYRGDFEKKFQAFIDNIKKNQDIVFIDEVHLILHTGEAEGGIGIGQLLKPVLARGDLSFIGATTLEEYRLFEQDKALERRFHTIFVQEPTLMQMHEMAENISATYAQFHKIEYTSQSLAQAIELADKLLPHRNFPDKFIDLIDEAGAKSQELGMKTIQNIEPLVAKSIFQFGIDTIAYLVELKEKLCHRYPYYTAPLKSLFDFLIMRIEQGPNESRPFAAINLKNLDATFFYHIMQQLQQVLCIPIIRMYGQVNTDQQLREILEDKIFPAIQVQSSNLIWCDHFEAQKHAQALTYLDIILHEGFYLTPLGNKISFTSTFWFFLGAEVDTEKTIDFKIPLEQHILSAFQHVFYQRTKIEINSKYSSYLWEKLDEKWKNHLCKMTTFKAWKDFFEQWMHLYFTHEKFDPSFSHEEQIINFLNEGTHQE